MDKIITIDGREVGFRATALTPRLYRHKIGRDIIQDLNSLRKAYAKAATLPADATEDEKREAQLSVLDLEIFEDVAYIMARHHDPSIPSTPEEWLEGFGVFSIYEILPEILALWEAGQQTTSVPKNV